MAATEHTVPESPLLLIPGPTPVSRQVLAALARPTPAHNSATSAAELKTLQHGVLRSLGYEPATNGEGPAVLVTAGSGTSAMESTLVNTVAPGSPVVIVNHGFFGDRFATIARSHGALPEEVTCEWGERVPVAAVERAQCEPGPRSSR